MRVILDKLYLSCGIAAACSMAGIVILVAAQIVARFFQTNIPSSDDISGYMVAWTTFMGLSYAMSRGDHIRVDLFVNMLNQSYRRVLGIAVAGVGMILMGIFMYYVFLLIKESYDYGDVTSGHIAIPLWWVQMPFGVGVFMLVVSVFDHIVTQIFFRQSPS